MTKVKYICLAISLLSIPVHSQDKALFKKTFVEAEYFFMREEYHEAVHLYEELLKIDPYNANLQFLVGACYLSLYGEKEKAIEHLESASMDMSPVYRDGSYKERSAPREALFALARAYHIAERFDDAIVEYGQYRDVMIKSKFADIEYVNHQIKSCELAKSMIRRPVEMQFLRLGEEVNRFPSNYNPVVSWDDSTLIYMSDQPFFRAIMVSHRIPGGGWTEPKVINNEIGSDGDCSPVSISANGRELYLVKSDGYNADIYISYMKNGRFTKMVPLNGNINTDYMETHACISFNGKQLYFTSDRPGGEGGLDIWVSETTREGDWGEPRNLGPRINSHYSEETPFLAARGKELYFSSQGHATMGGFDFFVAEKLPYTDDESAEGWSFPKNLGYPVSTADDDLFYYPRKNGTGAYISAIREDISPARSIYALRPGKGLETTIAVVRKDEKEKRKEKEKLEKKTAGEVLTMQDSIKEEKEDTLAATIKPDEYYVLNSILFGFDSEELTQEARDEAGRVYEVMANNPEVRLQLTGHTDEVGADEYNRKLSERRAQAVADYLIEMGIDRDRIQVAGAGESKPIALNKYEDGSDSPDGRRLNRHVSIKLQNLQNKNVMVEQIFVPDHLKPKADRSYSILLVNSETFIDTMPGEVNGEKTALIITDSAFLYTAGNFSQQTEAMQYLNEVIDMGFPDAGMLEEDELERLIASLSKEGISVSASFTIQIMALKHPVSTDHFKPLEGVSVYAGKDGFHRYVYGDFPDLSSALERLPGLRSMGYEDAFIMSVLRYERLAGQE